MLNAMLSRAAIPADQPGNVNDGSCVVDAEASVPESSSPLALARGLDAPLAADAEGAEFEHAPFWEENGLLLRAAWEEWEQEHLARTGFPTSGGGGSHLGEDGDFIDPALSSALEDAFDDPSEETEAALKSLWTDSDHESGRPLPRGVYAARLLTESGVSRIRGLLDAAASSGIPARRPNGMNRRGVIVDPNVDGAVSPKSLVELVEEQLIGRVVRPVGRMLFPDRIGCDDDSEYFGFTIRYDGDDDGGEVRGEEEGRANGKEPRDLELREHRDASIVTLNVNLNLPEEGYSGSEVYFRAYPSDEPTAMANGDGETHGGTVRFSPGMAIIHLGAHRHGSMPISDSGGEDSGGKRYNLVIWLFGRDGDVRISPYAKEDQMNVLERWRGCNHTEVFSFV